MVFIRLGAGFLVGITIPYVCHENIYLTIASSLLHPHIKYHMYKKEKDPKLAV